MYSFCIVNRAREVFSLFEPDDFNKPEATRLCQRGDRAANDVLPRFAMVRVPGRCKSNRAAVLAKHCHRNHIALPDRENLDFGVRLTMAALCAGVLFRLVLENDDLFAFAVF